MLELLRRRGGSTEENFDAMGLLQTLCLVKMDTVDGKKSFSTAAKQDQEKLSAADSACSPTQTHTGAARNYCKSLNPAKDDSKVETEMKGEHKEMQLDPICSFRVIPSEMKKFIFIVST